MKARTRAARLAATIAATLVVLLGVDGLLTIPAYGPLGILESVAGIVASISLALSGALLTARLPANRIGWALVAGGLLYASATSGFGLSTALYEAGFGPALWLDLLAELSWVPAIVCMAVLVPLIFPTGHLPSPRWRALVVAGAIAVVLSTIQLAFSPFFPGSPAGIVNPLAVSGSAADVVTALGSTSDLLGVVCIPLVAASFVVRYRRAAGIERAQLRWFAAVAAIIGPAFAIAIGLSADTTDPGATISSLAFVATFAGLTLLPVAIGIAVLRYRLYDSDVIVRGTAVYLPLTAILAGLYAATVSLFQRLFMAITGTPSDAAVILSTLILATLFTPIRGWLQGVVDRRFGDAGDVEHLLEGFVHDVATNISVPDSARTLRAFLAVSVRALGSAGGVAFVGGGGDEYAVGELGDTREDAAIGVPVEVDDRRIGRLELAPRSDHRSYTERQRALLSRAATELALTFLERPRLEPSPLPASPNQMSSAPAAEPTATGSK